MPTLSQEAVRLVAQHPRGAFERIPAYLDKRRDRLAWEKQARSLQEVYPPADDWADRLAQWCGASDTFPDREMFEGVWRDLADTIGVHGEGNPEHTLIGGMFDAVPSFGKGVWCVVRHLRPTIVVETGVARGITSRLLLEGIQDAPGVAHVWSIDLPHPANYHLGAAVTPELQPRWSLELGTSRSLLPALLSRLGTVDMFVHDSLHTGRNVEFELTQAWAHLRPGGLMLADDIHQSLGFRHVVDREQIADWFAVTREGYGVWGAARKPPA